MSIEKTVCRLVKENWQSLGSNKRAPNSLTFMKIAGKTSPNASIIAMIFDTHNRKPVTVAKIPRNPQSMIGIVREYEAMVDLRENVHNPDILAHIPCQGVLAESDTIKILLQAAGKGHPMVREMTSQKSLEALYIRILPWMSDLHIDGSEEHIMAGDILHDLVESPITLFMEQFGKNASNLLSDETQQYLFRLPQKVKGRKIRLCRQHGDFNAHNTLVEYVAGSLDWFTMIDWEDYRSLQLPVHDLNHFFTSNSHLLGDGMPPEESYSKLVLSSGWYNDLFLKSVIDYEAREVIEQELFWMLTPLYFVDMCLRLTDAQRAQQHTSPTWIKRMNAFIKHMGML